MRFSTIILGLFCCLSGCRSVQCERVTVNNRKHRPDTTEIALSQYGDLPNPEDQTIHPVFSSDSTKICLWWAQSYKNLSSPDSWVVISATNAAFITSSDSNAVRTEQILRDFPFLAPTLQWGTFFANATAYAVDNSSQCALRAFSNLDRHRLLPATVEMHNLRDSGGVVWKTTLPSTRDVKRLLFRDESIIVLSGGMTGYILDFGTGEILSSFTYGTKETKQELRSRRLRYNPFADFDDDLSFTTCSFAVDPSVRYLAAGGFNDRRLRIISLEDFSMLREFHSDENPYWPFGGEWEMSRLEFSSSGNFLIAESMHEGRLSRGQQITEIIDIENWKIVKEIKSSGNTDIHSLALSPDDTQMAYIHNNVLKIVPFVPQKRP